MKHRLKMNNLTGFDDIECFYNDFADCLSEPAIQQLEFDLTAVTFMTPETVLALLSAARLWYNNRGCAITLASIDRQVHQYLERIDLLRECSVYVSTSHDSVESWTRANSLNLLEITPIPGEPEDNTQAVYAIYTKARALLLGRIENRRMEAVCDLLNVIAENIIHSKDTGHVLMQCYTAGIGYRIHIGIADLGLGIPTTFHTRYPNLGNGSDYLLKSLDMGVTSRTGSGGLGLYNVNRIVRGQQGSLSIRSGSSMLQVYSNRTYQHDGLVYIPGTQVFITVWGNHDAAHWKYLLSEQ
ncbi:MAG: hypothetical protein HS103_06405 [Anaerolineales bacterium]|nr:hypothetical protein [Anaerolineales bacterium]